MINKIKVANRISALRKEAGLTQSQLADKLNVSTQAVSKWETGAALPDVDILLSISQLFKISINEILEGNNIFTKIAYRPFNFDGIAYFEADDESSPTYKIPNDVQWAKDMIEEGWVEKNWEDWKKHPDRGVGLAKKINEHGGLILEIGAGPGGGWMPAILRENFNANIIISDISPTVAREWKKLFDKEVNPPNVHYAVLDNCDLPFRDNSIDVISDGGGFNNTVGDKEKCIRELYRVLKPGGMCVLGASFAKREHFDTLPGECQKELLEKFPELLDNFYTTLISAGFKKLTALPSTLAGQQRATKAL